MKLQEDLFADYQIGLGQIVLFLKKKVYF